MSNLIRDAIRDIPDFPQPGIIFRDISPLLGCAKTMRLTVHHLVHPFVDEEVDYVVGMEARGFIFGALCAQELGIGFVPLRKPGKLPHRTTSVSYQLEYGENTLEAHLDALGSGHRVLLVDDLIATGGTAAAACELVERLGGKIVGCAFVIELDELGGREKLSPNTIHSLVHF